MPSTMSVKNQTEHFSRYTFYSLSSTGQGGELFGVDLQSQARVVTE